MQLGIDIRRVVGWVAVVVFVAALYVQTRRAGSEMAALRAREAELSRRYDALAAEVASGAARAEAGGGGELPPRIREACRVSEALFTVRCRIADLESFAW